MRLIVTLLDCYIKAEMNLIRRLLIWHFKRDTCMKWWSITVDDKTGIRVFIDRADDIHDKPDYIERDVALRMVCKSFCHPGPICPDGYCRELAPLRMVPAADVRENTHAEWRKISPSGIYECSACGQNVMTGDIDAYRYCNGCGAVMSIDENRTD